jgi:hypothetical protein
MGKEQEIIILVHCTYSTRTRVAYSVFIILYSIFLTIIIPWYKYIVLAFPTKQGCIKRYISYSNAVARGVKLGPLQLYRRGNQSL